MWNPPIACLWFWKDTQAIVIRLDDIAQTFLIICQTIIHRDAALIWSTSSSMSSLFQEGASSPANRPIRSEYGSKGRQRDVDQPPTASCPFSLLMLFLVIFPGPTCVLLFSQLIGLPREAQYLQHAVDAGRC
jgi:hypothetical protein